MEYSPLSQKHQQILIHMLIHDLPVHVTFFNQYYKNERSRIKSVSILSDKSFIICRKDVMGNDKRKNYYQLSAKGLTLAMILKGDK